MQLKLCPAGTAVVPYKHARPGQMARYIGRVFEEKTKGWPAEETPAVIDTDTARPELVQKIHKRARSGDLLPYDATTARHLNVDFRGQPVWSAGVWAIPELADTAEPKPARATRRASAATTTAAPKGSD